MEVVRHPQENDALGRITKNILHGRTLTDFLTDNHPEVHYSSFRPQQRRLSQKGKTPKPDLEQKSDDSSSKGLVSFPKEDPLQQITPGKAFPLHTEPRIKDLNKNGKQLLAHGEARSSSGVSSDRAFESRSRKAPLKLNKMYHGRSTYTEGGEYSVNPEPAPFMQDNFMSSTSLKKIPIPKRYQESFGGSDDIYAGQRGVMIHTDRYQFEIPRSFEHLNQRDRLVAEMEYMDYLRDVRKRRELAPHRTKLNLFMGGKKIEFEERFDLNREILKLKSMAMPQKAQDLFHGRGIQLPPSHHSLQPRTHTTLNDFDLEEIRSSAPAGLQRPPTFQTPILALDSSSYSRQISLTVGDLPKAQQATRHNRRYGHLPSLKPKAAAEPVERRSPILLSKEKRTVTSLQARLRLPSLQREGTGLSKSQPSVPTTARSTSNWVQEQNRLSQRESGRQAPSDAAADEQLTNRKENNSRLEIHGRLANLEGKPPSPEAPPPTTEGGVRPAGRTISPSKSHSSNPLKANLEFPEEEISSLRQTFQQLDTDMDGHLQYHQLKSQLPKEFSQQQENFVKEVYEITSSNAFFGVDEFLMMSQLTSKVANLNGEAAEAYGKIDFTTLQKSIVKYVDLFRVHDLSQRGRISVQSMKQLLEESMNRKLADDSSEWTTFLNSVELDYGSQVNYIDYLAHIPLFMTMDQQQQQIPK